MSAKSGQSVSLWNFSAARVFTICAGVTDLPSPYMQPSSHGDLAGDDSHQEVFMKKLSIAILSLFIVALPLQAGPDAEKGLYERLGGAFVDPCPAARIGTPSRAP